MARQQLNVTKKARGRPKGIKAPSAIIRLPISLFEQVDVWAANQNLPLSRAEAIRRLVDIGLEASVQKETAAKKAAASNAL